MVQAPDDEATPRPSARWRSRLRWAGLVALLAATGCVDQPVCLTPPGASKPAQRLSEFGLFADLRHQLPAPGVVPYEVAVPLYSDSASKHRFLSLPKGTQIHAEDDRWTLPVGSLLVKTFYFPVDARDPSKGERLVETRLLQQTDHGFVEGTYVWNDDQSDAVCSGGNLDVPVSWVDDSGGQREQAFHVPGTSRCTTCHGEGDNSHALGLRTRQMNKPQLYEDGSHDQISHLVALGVVDAFPANPSALIAPFGDAPLIDRANSYLDVNCGNCHFDKGYAGGTGVLFDLGHVADTFCRKTGNVDGRTHVIVPGHPEQSELLARMQSTDPYVRMPMGPTHIPDQRGIALLSEWIASLPPEVCTP